MQPADGGGQPEALAAQLADRAGQVGGLKVLVDQWVVGDEQAVLQGEVHGGGGLTAARGGDEDDVGAVEAAGAQAVVVLHGELDGRHPIVVAAHIAHAVQPAGLPQAPGPELSLDVRHVQAEEVDDRGGGPEQLLADLVDRGRGEHQRGHRAAHHLVDLRHHLAGLLHARDERDQRAVELQLGELYEQRVAHRLGADPGGVGQEEHGNDTVLRAAPRHDETLTA